MNRRHPAVLKTDSLSTMEWRPQNWQ